MERIKRLLTSEERFKLGLLLFAMIFMAGFEVVGIASILPFMSLVANPELIETNEILNRFYNLAGFESTHQMLVALGLAALVLLALANTVAAVTSWYQLRFAYGVSDRLSGRLIRSYLTEPYEFFLTQSTADLLKRVILEVTNLVRGVLISSLELISGTLVSVVIFALLLAIDPKLALIVIGILGGAYLVLYMFRRRLIGQLGERRIASNRARFKMLTETLSGIKEIKLYGTQRHFYDRFAYHNTRVNDVYPKLHLAVHVPRYVVETLAFGGILLVTLYLLTFSDNIKSVLPLLSLYAVSGYRLLPSLQRLFSSLSKVKHNLPVIDEVLLDYNRDFVPVDFNESENTPHVNFERKITFEDMTYVYNGESKPALRHINVEILKSQSVAFVGRTGSGKTTLVDVLTGLLQPTEGVLRVDDQTITEDLASGWQQHIGYVTQELFLLDDSVTRNIAFGVADKDIDMERVRQAARTAHADHFIENELPRGYDTVVGERGVRLSGGQRVRLGIARALYRKPGVLVLDEATSSLDGITEQGIIKSLVDMDDHLTLIIIAHRLSTVRPCDQIYLLENGVVVDRGSYQDLLGSSVLFSQMQETTS